MKTDIIDYADVDIVIHHLKMEILLLDIIIVIIVRNRSSHVGHCQRPRPKKKEEKTKNWLHVITQ